MSKEEIRHYKTQARLPIIKSPLKPHQKIIKRSMGQPPNELELKPQFRPPSIGKVIEKRKTDPETGEVQIKRYVKGSFLGKGGFAKVYEFVDQDTGSVYAAKVIPKASLTKARTKQKLVTEIKLHSMLRHKHVVKFDSYFEDPTSVYILMEMCTNKSMADLIKTRKRLVEEEVRYYMKQILDAVIYMHRHRIIHRDLKLGNLFLSEELNVKIGDFGLATRLQNDSDRRRTLCGTPNYIAPEVLERGVNGHSYEADIWSFGVILYTLIIGKPPFETTSVQTTYKRIKENDYSFPEDVPISIAAKRLIQRILTAVPEDRPSLDDIANDPFFTEGYCPSSLSASALTAAPSFPNPSASTQSTDFAFRLPLSDKTNTNPAKVLRKVPGIHVQSENYIAVENEKEKRLTHTKTETRINQEEEVKPKTISPVGNGLEKVFGRENGEGSKPQSTVEKAENMCTGGIVPAPSSGTNNDAAAKHLTRKRLRSPYRSSSGGSRSPLKQRPRRTQLSIAASSSSSGCKRLIDNFEEKEETRKEQDTKTRAKEIVKRRVSVQSARAPQLEVDTEKQPKEEDMRAKPESKDNEQERPKASSKRENQKEEKHGHREEPSSGPETSGKGLFSRVHRNLTESFSQLSLGEKFDPSKAGRAAHSDSISLLGQAGKAQEDTDIYGKTNLYAAEEDPGVVSPTWVKKWLDYSDRYGLAYQLKDGTIGAYFNDFTKICRKFDAESATKWDNQFVYIDSKKTRRGERAQVSRFPLDHYPEELTKKVVLLAHFQKVFEDKLASASSSTVSPFSDLANNNNNALAPERRARTRNEPLIYVDKWLRTKHAIVFRLSNNVVQVNFMDDSKLILSCEGRMVTYVDKRGGSHIYPLATAVQQQSHNTSLISRLKYAREILGHLLGLKTHPPTAAAQPQPPPHQ